MPEPFKSIGIIGLGIMGGAIARNLIAAGFRVGGFDIDKGRAAAATTSGAALRGSAAEAADGADLVLTSLPSIAALDTTTEAIAATQRPALIVAEISTFPIEAKERARDRLDPERILEVIRSGAGNSRIFELRGPMMAKGVYTPPTATMHVLQKDSAIIAEFARALGVETPMLDTAAPLYDEAEAEGYADEDVGAVHAVLARRAGLPKRK